VRKSTFAHISARTPHSASRFLEPMSPLSAPLSREKIELRSKNMRAEFMQDMSNIKELLLCMDELSIIPGACRTVVQINLESAIDSKENEREAAIAMVSILFKCEKLSMSDIRSPLSEIIECIDSFIVDSPRAITYLGAMISEFLFVKAIDLAWICMECEKLRELSSHLIFHIIDQTILSFLDKHGFNVARDMFTPYNSSLINLLGSERYKIVVARLH